MANPSTDVIGNKILKGIPLSKGDIAYLVDRLIVSPPTPSSGWAIIGTTTLTGNATIDANNFDLSIGANSLSTSIQGTGGIELNSGGDIFLTGNGSLNINMQSDMNTTTTGNVLFNSINGTNVFAVGVGDGFDTFPFNHLQMEASSCSLTMGYSGNAGEMLIAANTKITLFVNSSIEISGNAITMVAAQPVTINGHSIKVLHGSATLDFPSTTSTTVSRLTITVTGAEVGDPVALGVPNGSVTATGTYSAWVSSANTVTVQFSPKATEDPASGTFKVTVYKP